MAEEIAVENGRISNFQGFFKLYGDGRTDTRTYVPCQVQSHVTQ